MNKKVLKWLMREIVKQASVEISKTVKKK